MGLFVTEIFYSIQGESLHAGRPCVFVRLSGCNLRCDYCDTTYAYEPGKSMGILEIIDRVAAFECTLIEITGGEPLLQHETPLLIRRLLDGGYETMVETNGSLDISPVDDRCTKVVDMKCPSSGEAAKNDLSNLGRLSPRDQLKLVIGTKEDYRYAKEILGRLDPGFPAHHVLFSPVFGKMKPSTLSEWIIGDRLPVRLHLQLHKMVWPDIDRGV